MTTEVLRNMLYERSDALRGLETVVMDEVHYLQDPYRGAVWEEVLIHLPSSVAVACLSATISNAEEFGEWVRTLRGQTAVVIEERRPVPLEHHYLVGRELHPMHAEQDGVLLPNPFVVSLDRQETHARRDRHRGGRPAAAPGERVRPPPRGGRADPRGGGDAAGDLLRVQPRGVRPERAMAPRRRDTAHHARGGRGRSARAPRSAPRGSTTTTSRRSGSTTSSTA